MCLFQIGKITFNFGLISWCGTPKSLNPKRKLCRIEKSFDSDTAWIALKKSKITITISNRHWLFLSTNSLPLQSFIRNIIGQFQNEITEVLVQIFKGIINWNCDWFAWHGADHSRNMAILWWFIIDTNNISWKQKQVSYIIIKVKKWKKEKKNFFGFSKFYKVQTLILPNSKQWIFIVCIWGRPQYVYYVHRWARVLGQGGCVHRGCV